MGFKKYTFPWIFWCSLGGCYLCPAGFHIWFDAIAPFSFSFLVHFHITQFVQDGFLLMIIFIANCRFQLTSTSFHSHLCFVAMSQLSFNTVSVFVTFSAFLFFLPCCSFAVTANNLKSKDFKKKSVFRTSLIGYKNISLGNCESNKPRFCQFGSMFLREGFLG